MKVSKLIKLLSEMPQDATVVGFDSYNEKLTKRVSVGLLNHLGIETNCWHSGRTFKSDIPAGIYVNISIGG